MGREEHVIESMPAKDDLLGSGELVDPMEDLIPGVLRYETNERVQTDDRLLIDMVEDGRREDISIMTLTLHRMNLRDWFKKRAGRHRDLLVRLWK
jgi:hypothetical protein